MNPPSCSLNCFPKGSSLNLAGHLPLLKLCVISASVSVPCSAELAALYYMLEVSLCMPDSWRWTVTFSQGKSTGFPWKLGWRIVVVSNNKRRGFLFKNAVRSRPHGLRTLSGRRCGTRSLPMCLHLGFAERHRLSVLLAEGNATSSTDHN